MYRYSRADCRKYRLFHNINTFRASFHCRFNYSASFRRCNTCRHRYHYFGLKKIPLAERFLHIIANHSFCNTIISDNTVFHRTIRNNIIRRSSNHIFCFIAYSQNFIILFGNGNNGWFIQYHSFARDKYQCVCRP